MNFLHTKFESAPFFVYMYTKTSHTFKIMCTQGLCEVKKDKQVFTSQHVIFMTVYK